MQNDDDTLYYIVHETPEEYYQLGYGVSEKVAIASAREALARDFPALPSLKANLYAVSGPEVYEPGGWFDTIRTEGIDPSYQGRLIRPVIIYKESE